MVKSFLLAKMFEGAWGPYCFLLSGYWGAKWPGYEVDHLPPSSTEVKNEWSYTSLPVICLCLHDMNRNNFIFHKIVAEMS